MKSKIHSHAINLRPVWMLFWVLILATVLLQAKNVAAQSVGVIVELSGQLLAKKTESTARVLMQRSEVYQGDVLQTKQNTYAQIRFNDESEITLAPNTQFRIDSYFFEKEKPADDKSTYTLISGTLRSITGLLGKRSKDRYQLRTPAATMGIRGTTFLAEYSPPKDEALPCETDSVALTGSAKTDSKEAMNSKETNQSLPDQKPDKKKQKGQNSDDVCNDRSGLYIEVIDGEISVKNESGSQNYAAGEFGYAASSEDQPEMLTENPGIVFNPPKKTDTIECNV